MSIKNVKNVNKKMSLNYKKNNIYMSDVSLKVVNAEGPYDEPELERTENAG